MAKKPKKIETPEQRAQRLANMNAARDRAAERARQEKTTGIDIAVDPQLKQAEIAMASLITLARSDCSLFCELILRDEETGDLIGNTAMHDEWHRKANSLNEHGKPQNMIIWAYPESGKALSVSTEIFTTSGWTTMGALEVGDRVFGRDGKPCTINWVSPVQHDRQVYRLTFSDGASLDADADHQWMARRVGAGEWETVTTATMLRGDYEIPVCEPVEFEPIFSTQAEREAGYDAGIQLLHSHTDPDYTGIPEAVLRGPQAVRAACLRAIIQPGGGLCTFYRLRVARQVAELVRSLGLTASITAHPDGSTVVTSLYAEALAVASIEPVASIPVKCIGVDSDDHTYLAGRSYTVTHNSQQLSIGRTLWLLGRNPRYRIAILAAAEKQAKKLIDSIRRHIERNEVLHAVFPELQRGDMWQDNAISVKRDGIIKDPSVQVLSPGGKVQGARIDVLVIDDVLVEDNTRTAYLREKTATWIRTSAFSRMSKRGQIIMLANAFHPEDFAHILAKEGGFWSKKYPVLTPDGKSAWPERWPLERIEQKRTADGMGATEFSRMYMCEPRNDSDARFKADAIEAAKLRGQGWPLFENLESFLRFVGDDYWFRTGTFWGSKASRSWRTLPPGFITVTGVDLGVSRKDSADPTVIFTGLVWPDGTRHPLSIKRGKFSSAEIMANIASDHEKFHSICIVEDNGAQDYIVQNLREDYPDLPVRGFRTGKNKHQAYGVESLAGELPNSWIIPNIDGVMEAVVAIWVQEMMYYNPRSHTGDVLAASWFFREGVRAFHAMDSGGGGISVSVIG